MHRRKHSFAIQDFSFVIGGKRASLYHFGACAGSLHVMCPQLPSLPPYTSCPLCSAIGSTMFPGKF